MFYDLLSGLVFNDRCSSKLCLWRADNYIFISGSYFQFSIELEDDELKNFSRLIDQALNIKNDYIDMTYNSLYLAFEEYNEGYRNLCVFDKNTQMILTLEVRFLKGLSEFLLNQINE